MTVAEVEREAPIKPITYSIRPGPARKRYHTPWRTSFWRLPIVIEPTISRYSSLVSGGTYAMSRLLRDLEFSSSRDWGSAVSIAVTDSSLTFLISSNR